MKVAIAIVLLAGVAHAGGFADAIARHDKADVDALRAQLPGDATIKCTLGAVYAKRGDYPRAAIYLEGCDDATLPEDIGVPIDKLVTETKRKLHDSDLSTVEIITKPSGMLVEIAALPGEQLMSPATVWVPAGSYDVVAHHDGHTLTNHVVTQTHARAIVIVEEPAAGNGTVKPGKVDFAGDGEPAERHEGQPQDIKHPTLIPKRLRTADPRDAGPQLDDPLAAEEDRPPPAPPSQRIGVRAGAGYIDHMDGHSPLGVSLAGEAHFAIVGETMPLELAIRADYLSGQKSRVGSAAGVQQVIFAPDAAWLAVGLALHAQYRDSSLGVGGDANLELALRRLPVTVGVRYEQGFSDTSQHALVLELGFDVRRF